MTVHSIRDASYTYSPTGIPINQNKSIASRLLLLLLLRLIVVALHPSIELNPRNRVSLDRHCAHLILNIRLRRALPIIALLRSQRTDSHKLSKSALAQNLLS